MIPYYSFFDHDFLSALGGKKNRELWATYYFLANGGIEPKNSDAFDVEPAEPVDVIYDSRKFQITTGSQDQDAVVNILAKSATAQKGNTHGSWHELSTGQKVRIYETTRNLYEGLDNDILRPIRNKVEQYGQGNSALNDVTLIIFLTPQLVCLRKRFDGLFSNKTRLYSILPALRKYIGRIRKITS